MRPFFFSKAAVKSGNLPPAVAASRGLHRWGMSFAWDRGFSSRFRKDLVCLLFGVCLLLGWMGEKNCFHWLDNVTVWMILLGKLQVYLFKAPIFSAKNM